MGPSPAAFVRAFDPARDRERFAHLVHRWTNGADFAALTWILHQMIERADRSRVSSPKGLPMDAVDVGEACSRFRRARWRSISSRLRANEAAAGRRLLLLASVIRRRLQAAEPVPALDGPPRSRRSRRVVEGRPGQLIVPLDTHIIRVGRCLRPDALSQSGMADGRRHHRVAAPPRSRRSGQVRLLDLPPRHDERLRIRQELRRSPGVRSKALVIPAERKGRNK